MRICGCMDISISIYTSKKDGCKYTFKFLD